jgi:quinol monooxygenase YgiN
MTRSYLRLRARPGKCSELRQELDRLEVLAVLRGQAGLLGVELLVSEDDPDELLLTFSWASAGHYARWRVSGGWQALLRAIDGLLAEDPVSSRHRLVDAVG